MAMEQSEKVLVANNDTLKRYQGRFDEGITPDRSQRRGKMLDVTKGQRIIMNVQKSSSSSLPGKIMDSAYSCFQKKGFDETTISDICKPLNIKDSQFHTYFESLDEVLEILWAR